MKAKKNKKFTGPIKLPKANGASTRVSLQGKYAVSSATNFAPKEKAEANDFQAKAFHPSP